MSSPTRGFASARPDGLRSVPAPVNGLSSLLLLTSLAAAPAPAPPPEDGTYKQLELFARVLSYVQNNYVEKVDERQLVYGAIRGMLETLDPHTVFMPPEVFKEMKIDTSGEFGGLGLDVARRGDALVVVSPLDDTPAARAGIQPGDEILAIDGESTVGMDVVRATAKMRGPAGQRVTLTLMRAGFQQPQEIVLLRDHVRIVSVQGAPEELPGADRRQPQARAGPSPDRERRPRAVRPGPRPAQQPRWSPRPGG